jgi:hypothetical protein
VDSCPTLAVEILKKRLLVGLELLPKHFSFVQIFAEKKEEQDLRE